ncbi:MAG: ATP-binding protein [Actinobacteria bacterium]|nr:ATP-binding protein [Actinomycetota bacterium]
MSGREPANRKGVARCRDNLGPAAATGHLAAVGSAARPPADPTASDLLTSRALLAGAGGTTRVAGCSLDPTFRSVAAARDFVGRTLRDWQLEAMLDDAVQRDLRLVTSELVTNALRHGLLLPPGEPPWPATVSDRPDEPIGLALLCTDSHLTCAVSDPGSQVPVHRTPGLTTESGRGLMLVEALSLRWGWTARVSEGGRTRGKTVWALFPIVPAAMSAVYA